MDDFEKFRSKYESEEHWELKKNFLETHKNRFSEERLITLTQLFLNIELLRCRYSDKVMTLIAELGKGIGTDYKTKQLECLQRTFVSASDAAKFKIKRSLQRTEGEDEFEPNNKKSKDVNNVTEETTVTLSRGQKKRRNKKLKKLLEKEHEESDAQETNELNLKQKENKIHDENIEYLLKNKTTEKNYQISNELLDKKLKNKCTENEYKELINNILAETETNDDGVRRSQRLWIKTKKIELVISKKKQQNKAENKQQNDAEAKESEDSDDDLLLSKEEHFQLLGIEHYMSIEKMVQEFTGDLYHSSFSKIFIIYRSYIKYKSWIDLLKESLAASQLKLRRGFQTMPNKIKCVLSVNVMSRRLVLGRGFGDNEKSARIAASSEAVNLLLKNCVTIEVKKQCHNRVVSVQDVGVGKQKNKNLTPIPADNAGYKMLQLMGWTGGPLGIQGSGITQPVSHVTPRNFELKEKEYVKKGERQRVAQKIFRFMIKTWKEYATLQDSTITFKDVPYSVKQVLKRLITNCELLRFKIERKKIFNVSLNPDARYIFQRVFENGGETELYKLHRPETLSFIKDCRF